MSADIQQARDVLAKIKRTGYGPAAADLIADGSLDEVDARTIGIMTDPDLLDAIDGLLVLASRLEDEGLSTAFLIRVGRIAAAIIAADEGMSS